MAPDAKVSPASTQAAEIPVILPWTMRPSQSRRSIIFATLAEDCGGTTAMLPPSCLNEAPQSGGPYGWLAELSLPLSNIDQTPASPSQLPLLAALEYSVARCSKKLACSTPLRISLSQGSGWALICW